MVSCFAALKYWTSHPLGQVALLVLVSLPLGIYSIVVAQDSYNKLKDAVGEFEDILATWAVKPLTALEVKPLGSSCSTG